MHRLHQHRGHDALPDQPSETDVVAQIYDRVMAGAGKAQLRAEFAGDRVYIPVRPHLTGEQRRQIADELARRTAAEVARRWGISVRQAYRIRRAAKGRDL